MTENFQFMPEETPTEKKDKSEKLLTESEKILKERFFLEKGPSSRLPSDAAAPAAPARIESLVLADDERRQMPLTKSKYIVRENPHLVQWEREVRKFLRNLSPEHENRVSAVMIYEWATGIRIVDIMAAEKETTKERGTHTTWRGDLRKINKLLNFYFGKPYMTYIAGHKVPKAYRVRVGYYIKRHRPMTLTLWAEYNAGTLNP